MTNHPHRGNSIFQLDGHTGDWLVFTDALRLRERPDGTVLVVGATRKIEVAGVRRFLDGSGRRQLSMQTERIVLSHNTPRGFQPLVDRVFPSMADARAAIIEIVEAPARKRQAANERRLIAAGYRAGLIGKDRDLALKTLKWANSEDPTLRAKAQQTFALLSDS